MTRAMRMAATTATGITRIHETALVGASKTSDAMPALCMRGTSWSQRSQWMSRRWLFTPYGTQVTRVSRSRPFSIASEPSSEGRTVSSETTSYASFLPRTVT